MRLFLTILLAVTALNIAFAAFVIAYEHHHLHKENHVLENLQALLLAFGMVVYFLPHRTGSPLPSLSMALSLLCFSFLLRELDVERLNVPEFFHWIFSGIGKRILLVFLWILMLQRIYRESREGHMDWRSLLYSRLAVCMLGVMGLLIFGYVMDAEVFSLRFSRLYEELAETNAYLLLVASRFINQVSLGFAREA